ncbi:MAG: A24 family peptidase [Hyphomicrobiales bacterium]|uniref:prepilin peptidase n=1 Tax=Aestuariivirga sp. TaxID=2650926 RepID=UPI0035B28D8D
MTDDGAPLLSRTEIGGCVAFALLVTIASMILLPPAASLATGVLALFMALITLTDLRHFIIPDLLSLPAVPLGALANIAVFHGEDWMAGLSESLLGAVLAAGTFYLLRALWFHLRSVEGLGLGDVKLAAVAGAWLGPGLLAPACLASALSGLLAVLLLAVRPGRRIGLGDEVPFGSFIAPVILLTWGWRILDAVPFW